MGIRSLKRRVELVESILSRLVDLLPGERELWRYIRQELGEPDLLHIAELWWPVVHRAMRQGGFGEGPYARERILEYLEALKDGPRPPYTINMFLPPRPISEASPGDLVLEACLPLEGEAVREHPDIVNRDGGQESDIEPETRLRIEGVSNGNVGSYRQTIMESDPRDDWTQIDAEQFRDVHEFKGDGEIRIVCDFGSEESDAGMVEEAWATNYENPEARAYRFGVYFGGFLVEEVVLVGVDGGRARLPRPKGAEESWVVDPFDHKIAEIVNLGGNLEEYMMRSGLRLP